MFASINYGLLCLSLIVISSQTCLSQPPSLSLSHAGSPEYSDVVVMRAGDNLTLTCELLGDPTPRVHVWNYVPANDTQRSSPFTVTPSGPGVSSTLHKARLSPADSGHYMCSAPPFSVNKYILVQTRGPEQCARGAFWCGSYCVLSAYVCDGHRDCLAGEDEAPALCQQAPCARSDKLNCSSGRCIPEAACCRPGAALCQQPACCDEHARYARHDGVYGEAEFPPLFDDRRAPDDYGFIQSTIYTVTACALIFMIAVVLLVSAICKMHMKRAALRSYAHAERATRHHYSVQYAQTHRFPPCYEASRLLEQERAAPHSAPQSASSSPNRQPLQCTSECPPDDGDVSGGAACGGGGGVAGGEPGGGGEAGGFGLARLSAIFSSRYRQVPTQCLDVEMTDVRSASLNSSPTRTQARTQLNNYRSPTYCDLNTDYFFNPETSNCGPDLNYMATPMEFFRRRTLRGNLDLDRLRPRPLTLQLGRFQLSIPRLGRRTSLERRPDTPNVAELNIDDLDFVRLNSNDTYTLNGRTIRLLGANFENYPGTDTARPPPYNDAMRYKLYGPPPEYLSRDDINSNITNTVTVPNTSNEEQARSNVEMPPCYDELASGVDANANIENNAGDNNNEVNNVTDTVTSNVLNNVNFGTVVDNLPAIDSDVNANETR